MTVKELREAIKMQTMAINERLVEYYEQGAPDKLVNKEIEYLKEITGTAKKNNYISMRSHRKNKMELELQLNELRYFENWDIFTPQGQMERSKSAMKSYRSYKRNHGNLSYENWRRTVTVLGTVGADIFNQFGGSNDTQAAVEDAVRKGRSPGEIIRAMQHVIKDNEGSMKSTQDYADDLRALLKLET